MTAPSIDTYVETHRQRFLDELFELLRIPSISTLPEHGGDVARAAAFVAAQLGGIGMENVEIIPTARHPLVYGEWLHAPGKPTVLCYGHYDVQPADPVDLWISPPFEPTIRDGNIYARGAVDDKGQMMAQFKAVETLRATHGSLPVNVKFLIEGEEEIGGPNIAAYVAAQGEKLKADVALVCDTSLYAPDLPTLCVGLRGLIYLEVTAQGPARDLHSGLYGGAAPNAVEGLVRLLAKAKDDAGRLRIDGIYEDVAEPAPAEIASWRRLPFDEKAFLEREVGASSLTGEPDRTVLERLWSRPSFEIHGIGGGFTGAGSKTVIPAQATAKVSFRVVPNQDPEKVIGVFTDWAARNAPAGVTVSVKALGMGPAVVVDPDHPAVRVAAEVMAEVFGKPVVYTRSGGSVPVVADFARRLGLGTVMMGFGLPDDALHSPNEKFRLENYYTGIRTIARFLARYGQA